MSHAQQPDALRNLVRFMICLAILGSILALAWYFAVVLPVQHAAALIPPPNVT